jgi:FG-GAP repeat
VFSRTGTTWTQQSYLKASNPGVEDWFGVSISMSADGNTLAIGADLEDSSATGINGSQSDNSALDSGAVYVFARTVNSWAQQAYIKASNTGSMDHFAESVSLSSDGSTMAITANYEDSAANGINGNQTDNSTLTAGAAYVFVRNAGTWAQQAYVKASNTGSGDGFGDSAALSADGNTLAVGATGEGSSASGINGNQTDSAAENSGAVYVFVRSANVWNQQAYIKASNTGASDGFGSSVHLTDNGNGLTVGAKGEDSSATGSNGNQSDNSAIDSGAVYVLNRTANIWSQQLYLKASNTGEGDYFGSQIVRSSTGNTLWISAPSEDSAATGVNGNQANDTAYSSGAVYVYPL